MTKDQLVKALEGQGKNRLAQAIAHCADKNILEYSKSLYQFSNASKIEPAFIHAIEDELGRLNYSKSDITFALASLKKYPVIQTANHVMPSLNPRPLCIEWLTTLGSPHDALSFSGHLSSVPFSGGYKQGRLRLSGTEVNLIPSPLQDALVWNAPIPERTKEELKKLASPFAELFGEISSNATYTAWALRTSHAITQQLLGEKKVLFFDIAEVCRLYLINALATDSPIIQLFFDEQKRSVFQSAFPKLPLFIHEYTGNRRIKSEPIWMQDNTLAGEHFTEPLSKETLHTLLTEKKICPNTFLLYVILAANNIRPLGSFRTVEYVPWLFDKLRSLKLFEISNETYPMLTTGMFPPPYTDWSALDYITQKQSLPDAHNMWDIIEPMAQVMIDDQANIFEVAQK